MPESFGSRLRLRREQQQMALGTIADQTKIKLSLLEELEHDDVSHWPSGIFRRAFIRSYANAIGLEPDVVVREFLELHPDPLEASAQVSEAAAAAEGALVSGGPPTRLRYLVDSAIGSMARLGVRFVSRSNGSVEETAVSAARKLDPVNPHLPELLAVADLCTDLGRVEKTSDMLPVLREAARILAAAGLIVWVLDPETNELCAALAHGYSDKVLAQLPRVDSEANNATAQAFRTAQTCIVNSTDRGSGALVVPLITPSGCAGVLAVELQNRGEARDSVRALATIFAAQLATLIGAVQPAETALRRDPCSEVR